MQGRRIAKKNSERPACRTLVLSDAPMRTTSATRRTLSSLHVLDKAQAAQERCVSSVAELKCVDRDYNMAFTSLLQLAPRGIGPGRACECSGRDAARQEAQNHAARSGSTWRCFCRVCRTWRPSTKLRPLTVGELSDRTGAEGGRARASPGSDRSRCTPHRTRLSGSWCLRMKRPPLGMKRPRQ